MFNGPFQTVNQSMFREVANQWHCRAHNNLCPTLHKRTCAQEWMVNGKRTIEGGDFYHKMWNRL